MIEIYYQLLKCDFSTALLICSVSLRLCQFQNFYLEFLLILTVSFIIFITSFLFLHLTLGLFHHLIIILLCLISVSCFCSLYVRRIWFVELLQSHWLVELHVKSILDFSQDSSLGHLFIPYNATSWFPTILQSYWLLKVVVDPFL